MVLIKNGYDFFRNKSDRGAANRSTALIICESLPSELILLDIRMPGRELLTSLLVR